MRSQPRISLDEQPSSLFPLPSSLSPSSNPPEPSGILLPAKMKTSAVVSDTIGPFPSTIGEEGAAALDSIRRAQAGDVDAFELLYREHAGRIYALCLRLKAGDSSDATELMQDVFIRAWRRLETFRGDCAFSSIVFTASR